MPIKFIFRNNFRRNVLNKFFGLEYLNIDTLSGKFFFAADNELETKLTDIDLFVILGDFEILPDINFVGK